MSSESEMALQSGSKLGQGEKPSYSRTGQSLSNNWPQESSISSSNAAPQSQAIIRVSNRQ